MMGRQDAAKAAATSEAKLARDVAVARQWRAWARDGYDPRGHLRTVQAEGEPAVLRGFYDAERWAVECRGAAVTLDRRMRAYLALTEILELAKAIREAGHRP
jgi:hypothetical protein